MICRVHIGAQFSYISDIGKPLLVQVTDITCEVDENAEHTQVHFTHLLPSPNGSYAMTPQDFRKNLEMVKATQVV